MTPNIRSILVPTDFSPSSEHAVDYASALAQSLGASLHLIHVITSLITAEKPWEASAIDAAGWHEVLYQEGVGKLRFLAQEIRDQGVHASCEVRSGTAANEIVHAAIDYGADLIIMSTHGRSGLPHLLLGSVAEHVIRSASCPVLVLRNAQIDGRPVADERTFEHVA
jgi:universal stress protein A